MQFPSIQEINKALIKVIQRFPVPILVSLAGTAMAIFLLENHKTEYENIIKALLCMFLGLPMFISINIWAKSINASLIKRGIAIVLGVCCLLLYYFSIKDIDSNQHAYRFGGLFIAMHLLVSFIPYLNNKTIASFWNYNRTLFLRAVESGFFSLAIFAGIALAILALDKLFGVNFDDVIYGQLFFSIIGIFNTLYFLAGFPKNFNDGLQEQAYPRPLSIFCKYISIPIVFVYFIILYAFTIKIGISWEWPQGWISKLILSFSVLGILVYLLSYYLSQQEKSILAKWFKKGYFYALFPMSIVLLLALWRRFSDYGITENRYIVSLVGIWLCCISLYFIISKKDNIKAIPISLFVFILFALFSGPINIFNFPANNQVNRLESLLIEHQLLENGKIKSNPNLKNKEKVAREISNAVDYLTNNDYQEKIYPWFEDKLDTMPRYANLYLTAMDLKFDNYTYSDLKNKSYYNYYTNNYLSIPISDFDFYGYFSQFASENNTGDYRLEVIKHKKLNIINSYNKTVASFNLLEYLNALKKKDILKREPSSQEQLKYQFENENYRLLILPKQVSFTQSSSGEITNFSLEASFFIKVR